MNHGLIIKPSGALDFLSLGALVHRLDPGVTPFNKASHCDIHVSGGEFNLAANLSDCFRLKAGLASAMVNYPIGDLIASRVRAAGVVPFYKCFEHDGVTGPNMATVYSDRGQGMRPPVVFYNRANEAAAQLKPGDFDWPTIFAGGVRWFHSGGIFAALSEMTPDLIIEGMKFAKAAGAVVSFDLNFRPRLWNKWGGRRQSVKVFKKIVGHLDVLFGGAECLLEQNEFEAFEKIKTSASQPGKIKFDSESYLDVVESVLKMHPNVKLITTPLRAVHSSNHHTWSGVACLEGNLIFAPTCELDVLDRVGAGDAYASGFIYGLLNGRNLADSLKLGWAHGALVTSFPGDISMSTLEQVLAFAEKPAAEIQR